MFRIWPVLLLLLALAGASAPRIAVEVVEGPSLPLPVHDAAVATDGEVILMAGGRQALLAGDAALVASVHAINPTADVSWALPDLPCPLEGARAAVLDGQLYVVGGEVPTSEACGREDMAATDAALQDAWGLAPGWDSGTTSAAWRLDLADSTATWEPLAPLSVPRRDHALVVLDGDLVVVGGRYPAAGDAIPMDPALQDCGTLPGDTGSERWCALAFSERYDPQVGAWVAEDTLHLQESRYDLGAAVVDGRLHAVGGRSFLGEVPVPLRSRETIDPDPETGFADRVELGRDVPAATGTAWNGSVWFLLQDTDEGSDAALLVQDPSSEDRPLQDLDGLPVTRGALVQAQGSLWLAGARLGSVGADLPSLLELAVSLSGPVTKGCGGWVVTGSPSTGAAAFPRRHCTDDDGDGYGLSGDAGCWYPEADCDDDDQQAWPGRDAVWYPDADGDGFGDPVAPAATCARPTGYVTDATDCRDDLPEVHPGAEEVCGDDLDNDCSGGWEDVCDGIVDMGLDLADGVLSADPADGFGMRVAPAGDVDGDGYDDVLIGAPLNDHAAVDAGAAYVVFGKAEGDLSLIQCAVIRGEVENDQVGWYLDGGERGGVVGTPDLDGAGSVWVFSDPEPGENSLSDASFVIHGAHAGDYADLGHWVGDVDGDGLDDLLVGAWLDDTAGMSAGAVYLFTEALVGEVTVTDAIACFLGDGSHSRAGEAFGGSDLDGDGYSDLVVGAPGADGGRGHVYLVRGPVDGDHSLAEADAVVTGSGSYGELGGRDAIAVAGDLDGEGDAWLALGVFSDNYDAGATYLVVAPTEGRVSLAASEYQARIDPGATWSGQTTFFGYALAAIGDIDDDGADDLAIGAPLMGEDGEGGAFIFQDLEEEEDLVASNTGTVLDADTIGTLLRGVYVRDYAGMAIAGVGDVNGDGRGDIVVGSGNPSFASPEPGGGAWLILGREGP
ncbi:MAG: MopE-related protein [Pseudomonadota bacterium]